MKKRIKQKIKTPSEYLLNAGKKSSSAKMQRNFFANTKNFNVCLAAFLVWESGYSESVLLGTLPDGQSLQHK